MINFIKKYTSVTAPDRVTKLCCAVLMGDYKESGITLTKVISTENPKTERQAIAEAIELARSLNIECYCEPDITIQRG